MTRYERDKLVGIARAQPFLCYYSDDLHNELKRLRAMGFIHQYKGVGLTTLRDNFKDRSMQFDLKKYFYLTEHGIEYLKLLDSAKEPSPDAPPATGETR
jgi:hypothetical protein